MAYGKDTKQLALDLFMKHIEITSIAARDDMPTERTLRRWVSDGVLTDGIDWNDYREDRENKVMLAQREFELEKYREDSDAFFKDAIEHVRQVYQVTYDKLIAGEFDASPNQMKDMLQLVALLENQGAENIQWQRNQMLKMLHVCKELMDDGQFAKLKVELLRLEQQELEKMDPIETSKMLAAKKR